MAEQKQYPQATPDGEPIPFEIIRPLGAFPLAFTGSASALAAIPVEAGFLVLRAVDAACWVALEEAATIPADGVHELDRMYIGQDEVVVIDHNQATTISVIRAEAANGTLIVQTCISYADVRKRVQQERM